MKTMEGQKRNNDPWAPLPEVASQPNPVECNFSLGFSFEDPLHQKLDSERYIKSLESKLQKLTRVKNKDPSSKDIISSLTLFHDDQMKRYVDDSAAGLSSPLTMTAISEESLNPLSYLQRKLYPERQHLSAEELLQLLQEDVLGKIFEDLSSSCESSNSNNKNETLCNIPQGVNVEKDQQQESVSSLPEQESMSSLPEQESVSSLPEQESGENWANFEDMNSQSSSSNTCVS
uniref:Uncharacterized protein n=1 Tax=Biomphalaria glabrata TaxID=6526 RepID=A0A2C9LY07_BIOGL